MARPQRKSVRLTKEHLEEYIRLKQQGISTEKATYSIQERFGLPERHTKQAVDTRLKPILEQRGIVLPRAKKGLTKVTTPVDIKPKSDGGRSDRLSVLRELVRLVPLAKEHPSLFELLSQDDAVRTELNDLISTAERVPDLVNRLNKSQREIRELREGKLAQQQGDVNPPLKGRQYRPSPDGFTIDDITYIPPEKNFSFENTIPLTITERDFCFDLTHNIKQDFIPTSNNKSISRLQALTVGLKSVVEGGVR